MTNFIGVECRKMKPTVKHRPAIWEMMLGTVYAMNDKGEVRYFDYDWDSAIEYAGVKQEGRDPRVWRVALSTGGVVQSHPNPRYRKTAVLFVVKKGE